MGIVTPRPGLLMNLAVAGTGSNDQQVAAATAESGANVRPSHVSEPPITGLG